MKPVRKAVIPAAGLGTRFLPATKAIPKEMLPLVDKPVLQYIVEGAVAGGVEEVIIVTAATKRAIEDHFDVAWELEHTLEKAGKTDLLAETRRPTEMAKFIYVRQGGPFGNGHAVLVARPAVGDEPFAMLWGDDLVVGETPLVRQLIDAYERTGGSVVAVMEVPPEATHRYGVIAPAEQIDERLWRVSRIVEKPAPGTQPSNLAAVAGYVLTPDVFEHLAATKPGQDGEIWLVDAVQQLADAGRLCALKFEGKRYDAGDRLEYLQATVDLALTHPDLGKPFRAYLRSVIDGRSA